MTLQVKSSAQDLHTVEKNENECTESEISFWPEHS